MRLLQLFEYADSKPAGDYGDFTLTIQKTGATPPFIAHGIHKQNSKQQRKAGGKTRDEAIQALKDLIDKEYKYSDTVASSNRLTSLLFNVESTGVFFVDPIIGGTIYAKIGKDQQGPVLIVGSEEYEPELLVSDGFRKSDMRNSKIKGSEEAIRQMVVQFPAKDLAQAGFKQNGRYIIRTDLEYKDRDNHTVYPLTLSSVTVSNIDRQRINKPALTVGTVREHMESIDYCVNCGDLTFDDGLDENLKKWFKEKWVRFGPDGKIRGDCARGSSSEGKPKCLPRSKAHALGKKGRAKAASRKRRQDPQKNRRGPAKNVKTK